jgi:transposase
VLHSTCAPGTSWCARADEIFGVDGLHVLEVTTRDDGVLVLDVESDQTLTGCPDCGVVAVGHGRSVQVLHDAPCFARAVRVRHDDTTVSAIARHLGVAWDTCWSAIKPHAETLIKVPGRVRGVKTIGVDEHIWRPSRVSSTDKAVTVMVDLTRDADGCLHARRLDAVQGRSGRV